MKDTHFSELKNAELMQSRIAVLRDMDEYVGKYYSKTYIRKNVLMQSGEDIKELDKEMSEDGSDEEYAADDEADNAPPQAAKPADNAE